MDGLTQAWIRNEADKRAAAHGFRFDMNRAAWVVWWIGRYCRLYEGVHAGEPLVLRGAHSQPLFASQKPWRDGGKKETIQFIREYMDAQAAGEPCDWQLECVCRLFGWVGFSERWKEEIRRFTKGSLFVGKKNKKSPTLAAIALHLMAGDGEPGMKVFVCATTGDQAKDIAGKHAMEMVASSSELQQECQINKVKMRIDHLPTKSLFQPLCSGDIRSQKAKEGLNGSALVDEAHVVTSTFMARIVRMGISRKEPFILDFSTAGNDTESYGFQQWQYGHANNDSGDDLRHFFQTYEAPQGITDADLAENLGSYIRMANPALSHTVDLEEATQDYLSSRQTQAKLAEFKQYRLNVWSRTTTPWIVMDDWLHGSRRRQRRPGMEEPCWAGLDIGYTDEPSAFTIVFPNDHYAIDEALANKKPLLELLGALDQPVQSMTWYWLPRAAIKQWKHVLPYEEWAHKKAVKVQKTDVLDPNEIVADIARIIDKHDCQAIAYDPWQASTVLTNLQRDHGYPEERCWEFKQNSHVKWSFPCALLERLLVAKKLQHKRNPALDWEVGHATIKTDKLGGVSLVKPPRGDRKKVNGLASLIMALDAMAQAPRYYRSELIVIGAG
jgi:phage terminase large subunit-like protein